MRTEDPRKVCAEDHAIGIRSGRRLADLMNRAHIKSDSAAHLVHLRQRRTRKLFANLLVERITLAEADDHRILARISKRVLLDDLFHFIIRATRPRRLLQDRVPWQPLRRPQRWRPPRRPSASQRCPAQERHWTCLSAGFVGSCFSTKFSSLCEAGIAPAVDIHIRSVHVADMKLRTHRGGRRVRRR